MRQTEMARRKDTYQRLDAVATQLNQLAGGRVRPGAVSIAALVGLALTLAIGTQRRRLPAGRDRPAR